jgi:phage shock protein A
MSIFKRLYTTFSSRVDQLVTEVENHDAVVEATIREARQAVAKSKVRLARLKTDGERLRRRLGELQQAETKWTERARVSAEQDEDRALECLRRRQACQKQIAELREALSKHEELEARLSRDIRNAETRIGEMSQQRQFMRTRQSAAEALNSISGIDEATTSDLAETFERWDIKVTEAELEAGTAEVYQEDSLEKTFIDAEERETLRAELDELMNKGEERHDD